MNEWEKTVMDINQWLDTIGCDRAYKKDMRETYEMTKKELESQAEISFKAGMQKVVDWIENNHTNGNQYWNCLLSPKLFIDTKGYRVFLKEHGLRGRVI